MKKMKFKNLDGDLFFASNVEQITSLVESQEQIKERDSYNIVIPVINFYVYRATTTQASLSELIEILESDLKKLKDEQ